MDCHRDCFIGKLWIQHACNGQRRGVSTTQTEIYQEVNQPKSKEDFQKLDLVQTTNELESNRFRNYWYRLKNASERPKRFVVENDEGDRIEFTVKKSYKIYIEND